MQGDSLPSDEATVDVEKSLRAWNQIRLPVIVRVMIAPIGDVLHCGEADTILPTYLGDCVRLHVHQIAWHLRSSGLEDVTSAAYALRQIGKQFVEIYPAADRIHRRFTHRKAERRESISL